MPLANHLSALPRIRHLIHIRHLIPINRLILTVHRLGMHRPPDFRQPAPPIQSPSSKGTTMRINPSDVLFLILSCFTLLAAALVIGGLAAHPFAG